MIKGDKIKLVKPMGAFTNVGEVCEVTDVTEGGVISFRFGGVHLGCMSYDEYEKYFEPYEEPVKVEREWTEWEECEIEYVNENGLSDVIIETRDNGKKYQVRTVDFFVNLRAESTCSPSDEFNFEVGYDLTVARLRAKMAACDVKRLASSM
ncbi:hypothetical protein [Lacrimispora sp.]|uniref:hypothetical protein n=1 Tax=Lacrimispora sp. TaxID=2719234 RepID=UPI0028B1095C|nr:hypothetical protein [Lacrimispora sp.]